MGKIVKITCLISIQILYSQIKETKALDSDTHSSDSMFRILIQTRKQKLIRVTNII